MKKVLIVLSILCALFGVVIISLPFLIDLNKYKAQIVQEVEKKIDGKFDIGRISIRGLGVTLQNIVLESKGDFKHKDLLSVGEVRVKISLLSLLTANPKVTLILKSPKIFLVKNGQGKFNVTQIAKNETQQEIPGKSKESSSKATKLPALVLGAKISFQANSALLKYIDEKTNAVTSVEDLNITLNNISFNSPIDFKITALLSSDAAKGSLLEGKLSLLGSAKVQANGSRSLKAAQIKARVEFGELVADIKGKVLNFENLQTDFTLSTPTLALEKLKNSFGPLKKYNVEGTVALNSSVKGPLKHLEQCVVSGKLELLLKSKQTDFLFKTTLSDTLNRLKSDFIIESSVLNLDELIPKKQQVSFLNSLKTKNAWAEPATSKDGNDIFAFLRANPIVQGLSAHGKVDIKKIIFRKSEITNVQGQFGFENLEFSLSRFNLNAFQGSMDLKGNFRISSQRPKYEMVTTIQNFKTNPLLTMASPTMKDVFFGTLNASLNMSGEGATFADIKTYLTGNGKVEIKEAELKGLNMGKALQEKLKVVSIFTGSEILNEKLDSKINFIRSSWVIKNGKLHNPDGVLEAPGYGANLKGYASFERDIDYQGNLLIPAKKLGRELASLADSKGMVGFPFTLTGKLPKFSFNVDAGKVAQMATKGALQKALGKKVKEKLGIDLPIELPF